MANELTILLTEANKKPPKILYSSPQHLGNTAKYFNKGQAYLHYLNAGTKDNSGFGYPKEPKFKSVKDEDFYYVFDTAKAMKAGVQISKPDYLSGDVWELKFPTASRSLIKDAHKFITKVIINMSAYALLYDMENDKDFIKKFGKSKMPLEFVYPSDFKKVVGWKNERPNK
jgi:hypothetical protein